MYDMINQDLQFFSEINLQPNEQILIIDGVSNYFMSRIPPNEKILLYIKSGRRCAMPNCQQDLIEKTSSDKKIHISEAAHILPFSNHGPRASTHSNQDTRNLEKNLILVCANCHVIIDKDPETYTVEKLREIKNNHENKVWEKLNNDIPNVGFSELEDILKYLSSDQITIQNEYTLLTPTEKIKKNNLSSQVAQSIVRGMIGANQVSLYLEKHQDMQQGKRIRERFVEEYRKLRNEEKLTDDNLFWALCDFASLHSNEPEKTRAGLSVIVYLFEKCEVFEK